MAKHKGREEEVSRGISINTPVKEIQKDRPIRSFTVAHHHRARPRGGSSYGAKEKDSALGMRAFRTLVYGAGDPVGRAGGSVPGLLYTREE